MKTVLSGAPEGIAELTSILNDAADLYRQRNALVHGEMKCRLKR